MARVLTAGLAFALLGLAWSSQVDAQDTREASDEAAAWIDLGVYMDLE